MQSKIFECEVGGKKMVAEFNDLAEQANGSVILRHGETAVLATAVMSARTRNDIDYLPLTVDYEERFYAAGHIGGSRYVRREGRPSEQAILSGRVVDRTIRPLFHQHIRNEIQVVITVLALGDEKPDTIAVNAASLALGVSDIPWGGPVAAARVLKNNFDLLACGKDNTINMIEVGAKEASEDDITNGLVEVTLEHEKILAFQKKIIAEIGKTKKSAPRPELPAEMASIFEKEIAPKLYGAVFCGIAGKEKIHELQDEWGAVAEKLLSSAAGLQGNASETNFSALATRYFEDKVDEEIHRGAVEDGKRADGRSFGELRPLFAKAGGVSPMLHGSGIFYRGGTHVFSALTLGGPDASLLVESMESNEVKKRFMLHYNFPPYSSGETGRMGSTNRRAIGHGALAEKALEAVLPPVEKFPYTMRLVAECFASNGSTSMGSVCAGTLALMDGGVPITAPVAGIAMGLMLSPTKSRGEAEGLKYKILTDIQGPEDEYGDMDFKVAGTARGITAVQLDIKLDGVSLPILAEAMEGAKAARLQILDVLQKEIREPRPSISARAPEIITMRVRPDQIGAVIGGGGKTINGIKDATGVEEITIEDDGSIFITGKNGAPQKAKVMIDAVIEKSLRYDRGTHGSR